MRTQEDINSPLHIAKRGGYFAAGVFDAALALVYVCAITLMFWNHPRRWMERLSGVGRIGLTTYLMRTAIGVMLFFGIGLGLLGDRIGRGRGAWCSYLSPADRLCTLVAQSILARADGMDLEIAYEYRI